MKRVINIKRQTLTERRANRLHLRLIVSDIEGMQRPVRREDCIDGVRPCPWVGCKWNLYLEVKPNGNVWLSHPHLEPDQLEQSCVLDMCDAGETLEDDIGKALGVTHQMVNINLRDAEAGFKRRFNEKEHEAVKPPPKSGVKLRVVPKPLAKVMR